MRLKWYWRLLMGCAGIIWILAQIVSNDLAHALRIAYHPNSPAPGFGIVDLLSGGIGLYFVLVAASGRWRLW